MKDSKTIRYYVIFVILVSNIHLYEAFRTAITNDFLFYSLIVVSTLFNIGVCFSVMTAFTNTDIVELLKDEIDDLIKENKSSGRTEWASKNKKK